MVNVKRIFFKSRTSSRRRQSPTFEITRHGFAEIQPDETSAARVKRFASLTKLNPSNVETKLLNAELALADEDFPSARRAVRELAEDDPTVRSLTLMAAIEKGEGADDKTVRAWLNKALAAPRGNQWICESCQKVLDEDVWECSPPVCRTRRGPRRLPHVKSLGF